MPHFVTDEDKQQRKRKAEAVAEQVGIREHQVNGLADYPGVPHRQRKYKLKKFGSRLRVRVGHCVNRAEWKHRTRDRSRAKCDGEQEQMLYISPGTRAHSVRHEK